MFLSRIIIRTGTFCSLIGNDSSVSMAGIVSITMIKYDMGQELTDFPVFDW